MGMEERGDYEHIVVGSGPGGAAVARELALRGRKVLIVEYGPRLDKTGFLRTARKAYLGRDKRPLCSDGGVWISRARVLGGSSYVAMGNAVPPPARVLREWGVDLRGEIAEVQEDMHVTLMPAERVGPGTRRINEAASRLGWEMKPTPKCVDFSRCRGCGLCMFGCPTGAKWTSLRYIDEAIEHGAELLLNTEVRRVLHANGKAVGVAARGNGREWQIRSERIVLSAGALATPLILKRSGIENAGKGLANDVFQTTYGMTDDLGMQGEIILATYLEATIEGRELFPAPYMYIPFLIQRDREGGYPKNATLLAQARMMLRSQGIDARHIIAMMTKIRDERTGEVRGDGSVHKVLTEKDRAKLEEAYQINREILITAGARPETIFRSVYESGHPCCTAALGEVVDHHQQSEIHGLYVSDASVFPSPLGLPPILTIAALSKRLARHLLGA
jgi:choline dehydrogenase-like flavoprotein